MKHNQITKMNIQEMVDCFYARVMEDPLLRPVFIQAIGETPEAWKPHLQKMYEFWSSVMLGMGRYYGNPFQKHKALPAFDMGLFDRWLDLFAQTVHNLYTEEIADFYVQKSQRIAESFKMGLYLPYKQGLPE